VERLSEVDGILVVEASLNKQNWGQFEKLFGTQKVD
jgi:hypothetical protein